MDFNETWYEQGCPVHTGGVEANCLNFEIGELYRLTGEYCKLLFFWSVRNFAKQLSFNMRTLCLILSICDWAAVLRCSRGAFGCHQPTITTDMTDSVSRQFVYAISDTEDMNIAFIIVTMQHQHRIRSPSEIGTDPLALRLLPAFCWISEWQVAQALARMRIRRPKYKWYLRSSAYVNVVRLTPKSLAHEWAKVSPNVTIWH